MGYTLTTQTGRRGLAKHNDRTYEGADLEKAKINIYDQIYPDMTFEENERKAYEDLYSVHVWKQNEKHIASRHTERCTSIDKLYTSKMTQPDEMILELGNKNNHPEYENLKSIYDEYKAWHEEIFPGIVILDSALHLDEATPHIHIRQTYTYWDDHGICHPNQTRCLAAHGLTLPDPDKPRSQSNNLKMTYSAMCRNKIKEICLTHGIEIIKADPRENKDLSKEEYLDAQIHKVEVEKAALEKDKAALDELLHPERFIKRYVLEHDNDREFHASRYGAYPQLRDRFKEDLTKKAKLLVEEKAPEIYKELQKKYHIH